jgi:ABC-type Na+ efflux pump permease subunit
MFIAWQGSTFAASIGGQAPTLADVAQLAGFLFLAVCFVQYLAVYVFVPLMLAGTICSEREEHTLDLLFTTHLRDREIVLGKVGSRLAVVLLLFFSGLPVLAIIRLFGGIDGAILLRVEAATLLSMAVSGSLATYFSVVSPTPMIALVRTYWWLGLWLLFSPVLVFMLQAMLSYGNTTNQDIVRILNFLTWTNPLLIYNAAFDPYGMNAAMGIAGSWYTAYWTRFVVPALVALFFAWRAVRRLRFAPRPLFSLRRLVANPAFDRDPLEALARRVQPPPLPAQSAVIGVSPFATEDADTAPEMFDALMAPATISQSTVSPPPLPQMSPTFNDVSPGEAAVVGTAAATSPFAGESHAFPELGPDTSVSQWVERRHFAVRNPLWRRARLARVYDRDRYLFRIQIAGCVLVAGLALLMLLMMLSSGFQGHIEAESALGFLIPIWIVVWLLTAIVAGSSLVGDRRRGFLDQVLVTPINAGEVVLGTWLSIFEHLKIAYALPAVVAFVYVLLFGLPLLTALLTWVLGVAFGAVLVALGTTCSLVARQTGQSLVPTLALPILLAIGWPTLVANNLRWSRDDDMTWYLLCCAGVLLTAVVSWVLVQVRATPLRVGVMSISFYQLLLIALTPAVLSISDGEFVNDRYPTLAMMTASNCVAVLVGVIVDGAGDWHHAYRANAYTWLLVWCGPGLAAAAGYLLWAYAWTTRNFDRLTGRTLRNPDQPNYVPAPNKQSEAT